MDLEKELGKVFGRYTKWKLRCQEENATTTEEKIKLAEAVLAEPCTGTVAEARIYSLGLQGVKTVHLDEVN